MDTPYDDLMFLSGNVFQRAKGNDRVERGRRELDRASIPLIYSAKWAP
jgi:hypothetical protein